MAPSPAQNIELADFDHPGTTAPVTPAVPRHHSQSKSQSLPLHTHPAADLVSDPGTARHRFHSQAVGIGQQQQDGHWGYNNDHNNNVHSRSSETTAATGGEARRNRRNHNDSTPPRVKYWAEAVRVYLLNKYGHGGAEKENVASQDEKHRGIGKMKFAHSLQFNAVPEWSEHYIAYSNLKKL